MGRVLTLVIAPDSEDILEDSDRRGQLRQPRASLPGDRGAARRPRRRRAAAGRRDPGRRRRRRRRGRGVAACPVSSPTTPAAWCCRSCCPTPRWWRGGPRAHLRFPRRIRWASWRFAVSPTPPTAATRWPRSRAGCRATRAGDTDLAWSRITYWRALLASALDQPPLEPINSALVSGLKTEPALDILAGWLASRIDGPVQRAVGDLKVELRPAERNGDIEPAADGRHRDAEPHRPGRRR